MRTSTHRSVVDDAALDLLEVRDGSLGHVEERVLSHVEVGSVSSCKKTCEATARSLTMLSWNVSSHCFESSVRMLWFSSC